MATVSLSSHLCTQLPLKACMGHPYTPALNTTFWRANSNSGHAYRCKRLQIVNQMSQIGPGTTSPHPFMQWPFPSVPFFCSLNLPHVTCQGETFSLTCIYCTLAVCRTLHAARIAQSTFQCRLEHTGLLLYRVFIVIVFWFVCGHCAFCRARKCTRLFSFILSDDVPGPSFTTTTSQFMNINQICWWLWNFSGMETD